MEQLSSRSQSTELVGGEGNQVTPGNLCTMTTRGKKIQEDGRGHSRHLYLLTHYMFGN